MGSKTSHYERRLVRLAPNRVMNIVRDVTEVVEKTQALAASEERLNLALNAVRDGVWDWRIEPEEVYFNATWYTMLGYEDGELPMVFDTWRQLLPGRLLEVDFLSRRSGGAQRVWKGRPHGRHAYGLDRDQGG